MNVKVRFDLMNNGDVLGSVSHILDGPLTMVDMGYLEAFQGEIDPSRFGMETCWHAHEIPEHVGYHKIGKLNYTVGNPTTNVKSSEFYALTVVLANAGAVLSIHNTYNFAYSAPLQRVQYRGNLNLFLKVTGELNSNGSTITVVVMDWLSEFIKTGIVMNIEKMVVFAHVEPGAGDDDLKIYGPFKVI